MAFKKRKIGYWLLGILIFLIALRIALPSIVKWYLNNKVLNQLEDYRGQVDDVDLSLWRGAYQIKDVNIVKINTEVEEPFVDIREIDLSIQWKALWKGHIVGEVVVYDATVNFSFSEDENKQQTGTEEDWTQLVKDLLPIKINRFVIENSQVELVNLLSATNTNISLADLDLQITNIQNTVSADDPALPSTVKASANMPGYGGQLTLTARAMLLQQIPDFDYNLKFEKAQLTKFNKIAEHFTGMTFEKGSISVYSEMAMKKGEFEGYIKPLIKDMLIFSWKEENRKVGQWFKEFFSEGIKELFENQKEQQLATKIPLSGDLGDVNTEIWTTIVNALRNAYIQAFQYQLDDSVEYENVDGTPKTKEEKREERQEERQERREERQEKREERQEERQENQ
jgi:hypothetical protein